MQLYRGTIYIPRIGQKAQVLFKLFHFPYIVLGSKTLDITLYRYSNQVDWFDLDSQVQVPRAGKQSWNLILVRPISL